MNLKRIIGAISKIRNPLWGEIKKCEKAIKYESNPELKAAYFGQMGACFKELGKYDKAIYCFKEAQKLNENYFYPLS